jgi:hypothetical protein
VLGQRIGPVIKGQEDQEGKGKVSLKDYHSTLRNTPEERSSHQHRGASMKSRILLV